MADRCDVTEEIIRLESHFQQFKSLMGEKESQGRKLEFITQEINRETNHGTSREGVPPSQHPLRRRVRLVVAVCDRGVASVLRFADTPNDVITDAGAARGSLADAVKDLWNDPKVIVSRQSDDPARFSS